MDERKQNGKAGKYPIYTINDDVPTEALKRRQGHTCLLWSEEALLKEMNE
jgi:hypothetical protein